MSENALLRGGPNTTRFDDYIRAMVTKDWAALTAILTNTSGLLQNALAQLKTISQTVQANAAAAAASDTDATTQAAAALASATAAKTSETNAGLSESQASTLATQCNQILSDVTDMKNIIDAGLRSFAKTWLGDLAEDPTTDQYGNAIVTGAEYYNTTNKVIRIYTADGKWEDVSADAAAATLNAQQILQQCQQLYAQTLVLHDEVMAQINTAVRNNYGLATGKYGLYAALWDTTYASLGGGGAAGVVYKDSNSADVWRFLASQEDLTKVSTTESTTRAAAITNLENEKVNRSGDSIAYLNVSGAAGVNLSYDPGGQTTGATVNYASMSTSAGTRGAVVSMYVQEVVGSQFYGIFQTRQNNGDVRALRMNQTDRLQDTVLGTMAYLTDITTEQNTRSTAVTTLENEKVNRAGDTIAGLTSTAGLISTTTSGGSVGSYVGYGPVISACSAGPTFNMLLQEHVGTTFSGLYILDWKTGSRAIRFDQTGRMFDGLLGEFAYTSDITTEQNARAAADTVLENEKVNRAGDTMTGGLYAQTIKAQVPSSGGSTGSYVNYGCLISGRPGDTSTTATMYLQEHVGTQFIYCQTLASGSMSRTIYFGEVGRMTDSLNGDFAYLSDITVEQNARAAAITNLENEKVNRAGDTMTGGLYAQTIKAQVPSSGGSTGSYVNYGCLISGRPGDTSTTATMYLQEHVGTQFIYCQTLASGSMSRTIYFGEVGRMTDSLNGDFAYLSDITVEQNARAAAITNLENEKVNRAGDTMSYLNITGNGGIAINTDPGGQTAGLTTNYAGLNINSGGRGGSVSMYLQELTGSYFYGVFQVGQPGGSYRALMLNQTDRLKDTVMGSLAYLSDLPMSDPTLKIQMFTATVSFTQGRGAIVFPTAFAAGTVPVVFLQNSQAFGYTHYASFYGITQQDGTSLIISNTGCNIYGYGIKGTVVELDYDFEPALIQVLAIGRY